MERTYMKFSGIIKDITSKSKNSFTRQSEYIGLYGLVEILYSRTSNYTKVFAVFKGATKPYHYIKTTPGSITQDQNGYIYLTTAHHRYIFEIVESYK